MSRLESIPKNLNYQEIGKKIRMCRKEKRITAEKLAKKLGISKSQLCRLETNRVDKINSLYLPIIAKELDVELGWLLGIEPIRKDLNELLNSTIDFLKSETNLLQYDGKMLTKQEKRFLIQTCEYAKTMIELTRGE